MFGMGEMPQTLLEADARISLAVFDYFVNENSIRALIQNDLMSEISKDPRQKAAYLDAFPAGSQEEAELIQKVISGMEQALYDTYPTIAHFGRGRAK